MSNAIYISDEALRKITIDHNFDYWPDKDQMYITRPIVFPAVEIHIAAMDDICSSVEKLLGRRLGKNEWLEPKITIYGVWPGVENCIVCNIHNRYGICTVEIPFTAAQRLMLWSVIDAELQKTGESCEFLLRWAAAECNITWNGMTT